MDHYILDSIAWCLTRVSPLQCASGDPWPAWICGITPWVPWHSNQWDARAEEKEILLTVTLSKLKALSLRFSSWNNCQFLLFLFSFQLFCLLLHVFIMNAQGNILFRALVLFYYGARDILRRILSFVFSWFTLACADAENEISTELFLRGCLRGICNPLHKMYKLKSGRTRLLNVLRNLFCSFCGDM